MVGIRHGTDYRVCGRWTVGLSHVVLGDYIRHVMMRYTWKGVVYQLPLYQLYLGGRETVYLIVTTVNSRYSGHPWGNVKWLD